MKHQRFVHLHTHTDYSFLDGACRIKPLVKKAAQLKMPALAITDHGSMCGAVKFYKECSENGVKPIIGCEVYIAPGSMKEKRKKSKNNYHLTLLAKNKTGYLNLMRLNEIAYKEGFYHKPRIDIEVLEKNSNGLIGLSGCLKGIIPSLITKDRFDRALQEAEKFIEIFGKENFYLEMMDTGIKEQKKVNEKLQEISRKTGIKCVATNDCHYINKDDAYAQEILMCIGTGKTIDDPTHLKFSTSEYHLKSMDEMKEIFKQTPEAVDNTMEVAEKCNLKLEFGENLLPEYEVPGGETKNEYLEKLCLEGMEKRYGKKRKDIEERLYSELEVINKLGYAGYFLICWDFVKYARDNNIPVGPGRGSGAGSMVSYLLRITNLDPLRYGLLFERFLNPDRKTMPDLDIDFADTGRDKVIEYVKKKYGTDRVGQIATFSTLKARAAIRDVSRVLSIPLNTVDKIAKMVPNGYTVYRAIQEIDELRKTYESDDRIKQMLDIARKIEGCKRQPGVHAAGVVIAKDRLSNFVPRGVSSDNRRVTQYEGDDLVELGLLKMDFLGLRSLNIIQKAVENIRNTADSDFDIEKISFNDKNTFKMLSEAQSVGVFQIESKGFQDLLRKMEISRFEDIIALVALYRPGVMASGMTDEYIERKKDPKKIKYPHESLKDILKETYGVILYQEQVMQVARKLAGFSPAQADDMRKAMSKKIPAVLQRMREDFIQGAVDNKISRKKAENIFDTLSKFGGYGFNKSHSAAYATLAYQTAYLKANYPVQYMCSLLSCEMENTDKISKYVSECANMGIEVLKPSIMSSEENFKIEDEEKIRYGLKAIKNIGSAAIHSIVNSRKKEGKFKSFYDFCTRVDLKKVNRRVIESLIFSGAMDELNKGRRPLYNVIDKAVAQAAEYQKDMEAGQTSFFEVIDEKEKPEVEISDTKEWAENEMLIKEKSTLGFYFSGHPLAKYGRDIANLTSGEIKYIKENISVGSDILLGGLIKHRKDIKTKNGNKMLVFMIEDLSDIMESVVFPSSYTKEIASGIKEDTILVIKGKMDQRKGHPQCIVDDIIPLEKAKEKLVKKIVIKLNTVGLKRTEIKTMKNIIDKYPGNIKIEFEVQTKKYDKVRITTQSKARISKSLMNELGNVVGEEAINLIGNKI